MSMNRNTMYDYLKSIGMKNLSHWRGGPAKKDRSYHVEFVVDRDKFENGYVDHIILDWGYIRHFDSIHLCQDEIVIVSEFGKTKINMKYRHINKFEVVIYDDVDVM